MINVALQSSAVIFMAVSPLSPVCPSMFEAVRYVLVIEETDVHFPVSTARKGEGCPQIESFGRRQMFGKWYHDYLRPYFVSG